MITALSSFVGLVLVLVFYGLVRAAGSHLYDRVFRRKINDQIDRRAGGQKEH